MEFSSGAEYNQAVTENDEHLDGLISAMVEFFRECEKNGIPEGVPGARAAVMAVCAEAAALKMDDAVAGDSSMHSDMVTSYTFMLWRLVEQKLLKEAGL